MGLSNLTMRNALIATHDALATVLALFASFYLRFEGSENFFDRVPLLLMGATGPMDTTRRRPHIDWIHTTVLQSQPLRDFLGDAGDPDGCQWQQHEHVRPSVVVAQCPDDGDDARRSDRGECDSRRAMAPVAPTNRQHGENQQRRKSGQDHPERDAVAVPETGPIVADARRERR